ncbi:MAG: radical SAM protein [Alphaproteobacteria bacterium]|nr:radical SAM protein [Alphaproteobacteria bacterium]
MDLRHLADAALRRKLHHLVLHVAPESEGGLSTVDYAQLASEVGPLGWLDLAGGRPFERADLGAVASAFRAELVTVTTPVADVAAVVDGVAALRRAVSGELTVALALDGLQATHDRRHGPGAWDRVWAAFDRLSGQPRVRLELRTTVWSDNVDELVAVAQYVLDQGAAGHLVSLSGGGGGADAPPVARLRKVQGPLFDVLDRYALSEDGLRGRLRRNFHRMRWDVGLQTMEQGRQIVPCLAGLSHAVVRADGAVAACDLLPAVGSLREQGWQALWRGQAADAQREYIGAGHCHCTDECALHDSVALRPQHLPRLLAK